MDPARKQPPPSRDYPLRGILKCAECGKYLSAQPTKQRRNYTCKKDIGGCGHVHVAADHIEKYIYDLMLPMADMPALRDVLRAEESGDRDEIRKLVQAKSKDEQKLTELGDDYADGTITRAVYQRQTKRLSARIAVCDGRISALAGQSALDRLGGSVQADWDGMTADDKRLITRSLISEIRVTPAIRRGSNVFDRDRIKITWRYESIEKIGGKLTRGKDGVYRAWLAVKVTDGS